MNNKTANIVATVLFVDDSFICLQYEKHTLTFDELAHTTGGSLIYTKITGWAEPPLINLCQNSLLFKDLNFPNSESWKQSNLPLVGQFDLNEFVYQSETTQKSILLRLPMIRFCYYRIVTFNGLEKSVAMKAASGCRTLSF